MGVMTKLWCRFHDRKLTFQLWSLHESHLQLPGIIFFVIFDSEFFKAMQMIYTKNNVKIRVIL